MEYYPVGERGERAGERIADSVCGRRSGEEGGDRRPHAERRTTEQYVWGWGSGRGLVGGGDGRRLRGCGP